MKEYRKQHMADYRSELKDMENNFIGMFYLNNL